LGLDSGPMTAWCIRCCWLFWACANN